MEAVVKIQKWGKDLGISIPSVIAEELSLREGLYASVYEIGERIIIEPPKQHVSYSLAEMLSKITRNNIHHCIETGVSVGNEVW